MKVTWKQVADQVFQHLCENGINPLELSNEDVEYLIDELDDGLDFAVGEGLWTSLLLPIVLLAIAKTGRPVKEVDFPTRHEYTANQSNEVEEQMAHERDCRCSRCNSEDGWLEGDYEDWVSGCDWDM